jgi:hypothetical protein
MPMKPLIWQRSDEASPDRPLQKGTASRRCAARARSAVVATCLKPYVAATCSTAPTPATRTGLLPRLAARLRKGVCDSTTCACGITQHLIMVSA